MDDIDLTAAATIIAGALSAGKMHWDESQPDHDQALAAKCLSLAQEIAKARESSSPAAGEAKAGSAVKKPKEKRLPAK